MSRLTINSKGDTIVEVLIAIAIVSMVLGGAFAASKRATISSQTSEERSFASRLLETQAERLGIVSKDAASVVYTEPGDLCIDQTLTVQSDVCVEDSPSGSADLYTVILRRDATDNNKFRIDVVWEAIDDDTPEQRVTSFYKVYPGQ